LIIDATDKEFEKISEQIDSGLRVQTTDDARRQVEYQTALRITDRTYTSSSDIGYGLPSYHGPHWDDANVLVHVRFDHRTIPAYSQAEAADIGRRLAKALDVKHQRNLASGAPIAGVRKGAITEREAAIYTRFRGFHTESKQTPESKTLFIHEIQSDWGQQGNEEGFEGDGSPSKYAELSDQIAEISEKQPVGKEAGSQP